MFSEPAETQTPTRVQRGSHGRGWASSIRPVRAVIGLVAVTLTYYAIPLDPDRDLGGRIIASLLGLTVVGAVIIRHLRRGDDPVGRLFLLLMVAVAVIALSFHAVSMIPGQFEGLETRTDALYFTVVTLATIGYGDIHPVGQTARALVIVAMGFHVVFLTFLVSAISRRLGERLPG
ncbi:potassium channel family protein [Kocuria rhizophila]|uniref:potassium channel family protein n=1 Tax=Kocuria rhizophila TaxID=72000 RepID=UPI000F541E6B|nr:potassium channel family protein [Kocuria rhizophila]